MQTSIKTSTTLPLFGPLVWWWWGGQRRMPSFNVWLKEHLYWGPINTKRRQEGHTVLDSLIILQRVGQEPKAARPCPPLLDLPIRQYEDGLLSGPQIM